MFGYVYLTIFKGKCFYVGQHLAEEYEPNKYIGSGTTLKKLMKRYPLEYFENVLLDIANDQTELDNQEKYWIAYYRSLVGYKACININDGGMAEINSAKSRELAEKTLIKRYGYRGAAMHTEKAKAKSKDTRIKKYGSVTACLNTKEAQTKKFEAIITRYGSINAQMMTDKAREKALVHMHETNQEKYGSPYGKLCFEENRKAVCDLLQEKLGWKVKVVFVNKIEKIFASMREAWRETGASYKSIKRWAEGEAISEKSKLKFGIIEVSFICT